MTLSAYKFEGKPVPVQAPEDVLDRLAGLVISYKMLSKDRVTKAAKEQRAFIDGFLYGLEVAEVIDAGDREKLYQFFMGTEEGSNA